MAKLPIEIELLIDEETGKQINSPVVFKIPVYTKDDFDNEIVSFKKETITREELEKKVASLNSSITAHQEAIVENQTELNQISEKLALIPE